MTAALFAAVAFLLQSHGILVAEETPAVAVQRYSFVQPRMGVAFRIVMYAPSEEAAEAAARLAFDRVSRLDELFSDYRDDSELMRLCRDSGPGRPVKVSDELLGILETAQTVSRQGEGAFDVTVGPIVRLWRTARKEKRLPPADELAAARRLVGWRNVRLSREDRTVELLIPGMRLDLGGIAKGYAVEAAMQVLRKQGIASALVEAGGDMRLGDAPPGADGWSVAIKPLAESPVEEQTVLTLSNCSVATSGDAHQFVEIDRTRYSHIVDPKTGIGVTHRCSATVIGPDGATTDAWAKTFNVLGPERGLELLDRETDLAAIVVTLTDAGEEVRRPSRNWDRVANGGRNP